MSENIDLSALSGIGFAPAWAKKDAGVQVSKGAERAPREDRPPREGGAKAAAPFGERRPFGDRKPFERKPGFGPRKPFGERRSFERVMPLDCEVKILPETKALGTIIRKIQGTPLAFKLKEIAYFFLENPESILLKITPKDPELRFHQCKACGFAATDEKDVIEHLVTDHLKDYFEAKEIECEPPKGSFTCVAKCGLTGVLLGPPNVHEFASNVKEMLATKFPNMSEEEYRSHIEMVRDADQIEAWRKSAVKKTVYVAKGGAEGAPELTREQAENEFKRMMLAQMLDTPKSLMITADKALQSPNKALVYAVRDALRAESQAPYSMCFALRGAFHHRKLHFFRTNDNRGQEFVTSVELKEFDTAHAIPELAAMAKFIAENPCSPRAAIVKTPEDEKHLNWLISTGHVVAFTIGVFSPVEKFPKYGPQWQKAKVQHPVKQEADQEEEKKPEQIAAPEQAAEPVAAPETKVEEEKKDENPAQLA